ncbi:hypothetical protein KIW84_015223 [Lathyrus oleraceus]|uniref:Uncharacterized protein n=1 Tax=Pisum sativum TaxID=3888 RepID=A0A9D5BPY6_PEA|nr:hypothetical protein KIW84_015223 [Pisum sativum]
MKARVRQLRVELKSTTKGNKSITEFVLRIKAIANSLLVVGDSIFEGNHFTRGRSHGKSRSTTGATGNFLTCQLCGKYGYFVVDCWHRYEESFMPNNTTNSQSNGVSSSGIKQDQAQESS